MDFSVTQLFVLPTSNTLPTTGTWATLGASQFGVYRPDYSTATAGNVAASAYIYLAQGRPTPLPGVDVKRSDMIYLKNVVEWYKVTAHTTVAQQITDISDFVAYCGEDVTITLRIRSFYSDVGYYNGLVKSFTVKTPCCDCGADPCEDLDGTDIQALVDEFVTLINGQTGMAPAGVANFVTAQRVGTGATSKLRIVGKPLAAEPTTPDRLNFPQQFDRVYFWAFAYKGPALSQDFINYDACDPFATVTKIQNATYPTGSAAEVRQLEIDYNSYNTAPIAKQIFHNVNFNQGVQASEVVAGTFYDFYYLKFKEPYNGEWNPNVPQDEAVIICNPTGQNTGTIAVLTAFLGAATDKSGSNFTTTSTTTIV